MWCQPRGKGEEGNCGESSEKEKRGHDGMKEKNEIKPRISCVLRQVGASLPCTVPLMQRLRTFCGIMSNFGACLSWDSPGD
jgi:hypothetical protein